MRRGLFSLAVVIAVMSSGLVGAGTAVGATAVTSVAASQTAAVPDLSGTWDLVEHWDNVPPSSPYYVQDATYTFTLTGPHTYSVNNGATLTTTDVAIEGASVTIWFCGIAGTHSQADEAACSGVPGSRCGYWLEPWNFNFAAGTAKGTFQS